MIRELSTQDVWLNVTRTGIRNDTFLFRADILSAGVDDQTRLVGTVFSTHSGAFPNYSVAGTETTEFWKDGQLCGGVTGHRNSLQGWFYSSDYCTVEIGSGLTFTSNLVSLTVKCVQGLQIGGEKIRAALYRTSSAEPILRFYVFPYQRSQSALDRWIGPNRRLIHRPILDTVDREIFSALPDELKNFAALAILRYCVQAALGLCNSI